MNDDGRGVASRAASRMASFAKLTADWEVEHRSYLDNFIDFVLGAISHENLGEVTPEAVSGALSRVYGMTIPGAVVHQILRRAAKRKLVTSVGSGAYRVVDPGAADAERHLGELLQLQREQNQLGNDLAEWSKRSLAKPLTPEEALSALVSYIDTYFGPIMSTASGRGTITAVAAADEDPAHKVVAAFIADASNSNPQRFDYLVNFAKGAMLAAAVFSPADAAPLDSPFRDTWLILDTRLLLRVLGYEGEIEKEASLDFIRAAQAQHAKIGFFDFTLTEVQGIFDSAEVALTRNYAWSWDPGSLAAYFLERGLSSSDLRLHLADLEERWNALGITRLSRPDWRNFRFVVDDTELEAAIEGDSGYKNVAALRHDVNALSAIVRFRQGRGGSSLEDCRGVFITTNQRLLSAARKVEDTRSEPWPVAIRDTDLAALVWVKTPLKAPELPRRALIATCLTVLRPSLQMWSRYVKELERRHSLGELTDAEVMYVRQQYEQDNVELYIKTAESEFDFARSIDVLIGDVRASLEREVSAPLRAEMESQLAVTNAVIGTVETLEAQRAELGRREDDLQADLERTSSELSTTRALIIEAARSRSNLASAVARIVSAVILTAGVAAAAFGFQLPQPAAALVTLLTVLVSASGSATAPGAWLGNKIGQRVFARHLARYGVSLVAAEGASDQGS